MTIVNYFQHFLSFSSGHHNFLSFIKYIVLFGYVVFDGVIMFKCRMDFRLFLRPSFLNVRLQYLKFWIFFSGFLVFHYFLFRHRQFFTQVNLGYFFDLIYNPCVDGSAFTCLYACSAELVGNWNFRAWLPFYGQAICLERE